MKLLNALDDYSFDGSDGDAALRCEGVSLLVRLLYPACPHVTHALWAELGYAKAVGDLLDAPWPQVDAAALEQEEVELVLQVNGKLRGSVMVPSGATKEQIESLALACDAFVHFAAGAKAKKVIVVPGRLVNVVI
jgi:leucyl-tRNA synthetase